MSIETLRKMRVIIVQISAMFWKITSFPPGEGNKTITCLDFQTIQLNFLVVNLN